MMKRDKLKNLPGLLPIQLLQFVSRVKLIIPYYHMISPEDVLHVKYLYKFKSPKQFIQDVDFLLKYFNPICFDDLMAFIKKGKVLPEKSFFLSFDDGFREMSDIVAPILLRKGLPAIFFLNSAFVDNKDMAYDLKKSILVDEVFKTTSGKKKAIKDILKGHKIFFEDIMLAVLSVDYLKRRVLDDIAAILDIDFQSYLKLNKPYLSRDQILKLLSDGFSIGAHSIDHPLYADLNVQLQLCQTIQSLEFIRNEFGLNYGAFAFPHNDSGVGKEFFENLQRTESVDVTFGTRGIMPSTIPFHFQRISFEKPLLPARKIISYQLLRAISKRLLAP